MIQYVYSNAIEDLKQILSLQAANLAPALQEGEAETEGFVTIHHDLKLLEDLGKEYPHTLAKDGEQVVGYALSMPPSCAHTIEILIPMFDAINASIYKGQSLKEASYMVMGQICIDKAYRRQGIFRQLYQSMSDLLRGEVDYIITEVSSRNERSLQAHLAVGFEILDQHEEEGKRWITIILPLNQ